MIEYVEVVHVALVENELEQESRAVHVHTLELPRLEAAPLIRV